MPNGFTSEHATDATNAIVSGTGIRRSRNRASPRWSAVTTQPIQNETCAFAHSSAIIGTAMSARVSPPRARSSANIWAASRSAASVSGRTSERWR